MTLTKFLYDKGFTSFTEGYSQQIPPQIYDLINLTNKPNINLMEIGFNAGHSSEIFLINNPTINVTSFDLGSYDYVNVGKEFIDMNYPNRHKLILGDSRETIPNFINENKGYKFDIIFIDGGHDYQIAMSDIQNCFHLAHKNTMVIVDDIVLNRGWEAEWTIGPTKAWFDCANGGLIYPINGRDYCPGRGMFWGKYIM